MFPFTSHVANDFPRRLGLNAYTALSCGSKVRVLIRVSPSAVRSPLALESKEDAHRAVRAAYDQRLVTQEVPEDSQIHAGPASDFTVSASIGLLRSRVLYR